MVAIYEGVQEIGLDLPLLALDAVARSSINLLFSTAVLVVETPWEARGVLVFVVQHFGSFFLRLSA